MLIIAAILVGVCDSTQAPSVISAALSELVGQVDMRQAGSESFSPARVNSVMEVNGQFQIRDDGRLQDLIKTNDWPVLISENTYQRLREEFEAEMVDPVIVEGRTAVANVYKLIGRKGADETARLRFQQRK